MVLIFRKILRNRAIIVQSRALGAFHGRYNPKGLRVVGEEKQHSFCNGTSTRQSVTNIIILCVKNMYRFLIRIMKPYSFVTSNNGSYAICFIGVTYIIQIIIIAAENRFLQMFHMCVVDIIMIHTRYIAGSVIHASWKRMYILLAEYSTLPT